MYRKILLFLSRFFLSLWIVLAFSFLSLLWMNAPLPYLEDIGDGPFALVSINPEYDSKLYLPNQAFSCKETEQQFNCQTKIQGRLLDLSLTKKSDNPFNIKDCFAAYGGQTVSCRGYSGLPVLGLFTYEITGLGLSPQQLQRVEQKYWAINLLMRWSEEQLHAIGFGISLIAGMAVAAFTSFWLYKGQLGSDFVSLFISLINGAITFGLSEYFFLFMLLSLGYADQYSVYRLPILDPLEARVSQSLQEPSACVLNSGSVFSQALTGLRKLGLVDVDKSIKGRIQ